MDTDLTAANGKKVKALEIFAYALQYFKEQALKVGHVPGPCGRGGAPASQGSRHGLEGGSMGLTFRKQDAPSCPAGGNGKWGRNCGSIWQLLEGETQSYHVTQRSSSSVYNQEK